MWWHYTALSYRCNVSIITRIVNTEKEGDGIALLLLDNIYILYSSFLFLLFLSVSFSLLPLLVLPLITHINCACICSLSLCLSLSLLRIYVQVFLWWRPCTYVVTLLLLLFFITRTTNEEEKKVKIEDDDCIHCLAWNKTTPRILCAQTEIQWTQDITFQQLCHIVMNNYHMRLVRIIQTIELVLLQCPLVIFIELHLYFLIIINIVFVPHRHFFPHPIWVHYNSIVHVFFLLGILHQRQMFIVRHAILLRLLRHRHQCRNNVMRVRVSWTVVSLISSSNWLHIQNLCNISRISFLLLSVWIRTEGFYIDYLPEQTAGRVSIHTHTQDNL